MCTEWNGLDTLIVAAGVSSLRPLMELTQHPFTESPRATTRDDIARAKDISHAATVGNFYGPLVSVVTFVRNAFSLELRSRYANVFVATPFGEDIQVSGSTSRIIFGCRYPSTNSRAILCHQICISAVISSPLN
jgi:hypothetical protein